MTYAGLPRQMHDEFGRALLHSCREACRVFKHTNVLSEPAVAFELRMPILLELDVVVRDHSINSDDLVPRVEETFGHKKANEARSTRYQTAHRSNPTAQVLLAN
jgi:hypothetical protein